MVVALSAGGASAPGPVVHSPEATFCNWRLSLSIAQQLVTLKRKFIIRGKYKRRFGYAPDFKHPKTLTEKIQVRKLYDHNPLFALCSDKYQARDWVAEKIGPEYLVKLHFVGDALTEADLAAMPEKFVVKTNHDSGGVWVVADKSRMHAQRIVAEVNQHLALDFGRKVIEPWYSDIPRKVIVEEYLEAPGKAVPEDYKFHVFRSAGVPRLILQVDFDRESKASHHRTLYDDALNVLPFSWYTRNKFVELTAIDNFELMKSLALKLSEGFNYVRVDFYNIEGRVVFGEMTFAPTGGYKPFSEYQYDLQLGSYWDLEV